MSVCRAQRWWDPKLKPKSQLFARKAKPKSWSSIRRCFGPEPHVSIISATASNSGSGVYKVVIYVVKGQMTDCQELGEDPSVIPCRTNAVVLPVFECEIKDPHDPEACEISIDIDDGDMITYLAVATPVSGPDVTSSAITYSGGLPSVDVAMPVWWHSDFSGPSLSNNRMNLALFIDPDYGGDSVEFGVDLSEITDAVFFTTSQVFAKNYTRHRSYFDIWAFPFDGAQTDPTLCDHEFRDNAALLDGLVDGSAIIHVTKFTDCASIGPDGAGSVGAEESRPDWLLVHESGHFLFGLADEYGEGGQVAGSEPPNVFSTLGECELASTTVGAYPWHCRKFGSVTNTYRIQTSEPETMKKQLYTSDFYNSSEAAISARIDKCDSGACF